jgi:hypothetical protein
MRVHSSRAVAVLLAIVFVSVGVVPCACAEMSTPPDSSGGHCGPVGSGLRAQVEACSCACVMAQDEESATARVEPVPVRSMSVAPEGHGLVSGSYNLDPPIPLRRIGHSPPPSVPSILRI